MEVSGAQLAEAIRKRLREVLLAEQVEAAMERGKGIVLDAVVADLLADLGQAASVVENNTGLGP